MNIKIRFLLLLVLGGTLSACATASRTMYHRYGRDGGYSDQKITDDISVARFVGNPYTSADDAKILSQFRAIEACQENGYKISYFLTVNNESTSQTVRRTSTNTNFNATGYGGIASSDSYSWNDTYHFPIFDTYYSCYRRLFLAGMNLRQIAADDIKEYSKDKLSAVQIMQIQDDSPNRDTFQLGDIILKVNNQRTLMVPDMIKAINTTSNKNKIKAVIVRDGKTKTVYFKASDSTDKIEKMNSEIVDEVCEAAPDVGSRSICFFKK